MCFAGINFFILAKTPKIIDFIKAVARKGENDEFDTI